MKRPFRDYDPAIAREFVASWEGCKLTAYEDVAGVWTIGYGHTGRDVFPGLVIAQEQADDWLISDLGKHADGIAGAIKVPITRGQYIAILSFTFNCGVAAFKRSSILRNLNRGAIQASADAFRLWVKAGGKTIPGLVRRRAAERKCFLTPDEN